MLSSAAIEKIRLIDKLRDKFEVCKYAKIDFPQIIVVGDQSTGKSSVLEAISGISLPRGMGTVTICPLVIQLRHSNNTVLRIKFEKEKYRDISDTQEEIDKIQKVQLKGKLTKRSISLQKESPDVPTLTIVDLPGIVKTRSDNHDKDIITDTHEIAQTFMRQPQSIILCVLPADHDINSTDTIELAKKENPDKSRIIGVLTNIDRTTDEHIHMVSNVLNNQSVNLSKGYYGICVSREYLQGSQEVREKIEADIFNKYPSCYERLGVANLIKGLQLELHSLIDQNLPVLYRTLMKELANLNKNLEDFDDLYDNSPGQKKFLFQHIEKIKENIKSLFDNGNAKVKEYPSFIKKAKEMKIDCDDICTFLFCWTKMFEEFEFNLSKIYTDNFASSKAKFKDSTYLRTLITKTRTDSMAVFVNSEPFRNIIHQLLTEFETVAILMVSKCEELGRELINPQDTCSNGILGIGLDKYQKLEMEIKDICLRCFENQTKETKSHIKYFLKTEKRCYCPEDFIKAPAEERSGESSVLQAAAPLTPGMNAISDYMKCTSPAIANGSSSPRPGYGSTSTANATAATRFPPNNVNNNANKLTEGNSIEMSNIASSDLGKKKSDFLTDVDKLRKHLQDYVKEVIRRLQIVVPNCVSTTLFEEFHDRVGDALLDMISSDSVSVHFKLSLDREQELLLMRRTTTDLQQSIREMEPFLGQ